MTTLLLGVAIFASCERAFAADPTPAVLLKNAAATGVWMPAMGLGTGAYGGDPNKLRPECWSTSACPGVALNATIAYLQLAAASGSTNIRIDAANNYQDGARTQG